MRVYLNDVANSNKRCYGNNFKGKPHLAPQIPIRNFEDALKSWENLKFAKYLDVHDDAFNASNKEIRKMNYSFLDKLTSYYDKSRFIEHFCEFTRFPNFKQVSEKMHKTFINCLKDISYAGSSRVTDSRYDILDAGYDPTCSLGLKKSFPGSDLDKGYVIIKGNDYDSINNSTIQNIKGELWHNLDQRIVSLNHPNTAIDVFTEKQVLDMLNWLDEKHQILERNNYLSTSKNKHSTDPYIAGEFNRKIAKLINNPNQREDAKNFAFFIETVRENLGLTNDFLKNEYFFKKIKSSNFVKESNVTQIPAWREKIAGGYLKKKLANRNKLEQNFYQMPTETKYELIKDLVKHSSNDQSNKFSEYFTNDDDITRRYDSLLEALR